MPKLNVAVIGVGNMGQHHARVYSEMPEVNLVAVCDTDIKKSEEIAKKYNCLFYNNYQRMFDEKKIDAVSVAVPTFLHQKIACDVISEGINILLEKPIATNLNEARIIINKAKEKNVKLMVGHIERFNPAVQKLKNFIQDDQLGDIISINIKRVGGLPPQTKNANVILDLGIHDIDISNYLLGEYPKEVYGFKSKNLIDDQEDSAVILLKYSKASSFIEVNWITPVKIRTMDITGTKAFARLDYINQTITLFKNDSLIKNNKYGSFNEFISKFSLPDKIEISVKKAEPLKCEFEEFINAIIHKREPLMDNEEAYKALEIAFKI
jgi:UDP-N-acetylglucosamine 3-dehydrogenase